MACSRKGWRHGGGDGLAWLGEQTLPTADDGPDEPVFERIIVAWGRAAGAGELVGPGPGQAPMPKNPPWGWGPGSDAAFGEPVPLPRWRRVCQCPKSRRGVVGVPVWPGKTPTEPSRQAGKMQNGP